MLTLLFVAGGAAAWADDGQMATAITGTAASGATIVAGGFGQAADSHVAEDPGKGPRKKRQRLTDDEIQQLTAAAEGGDAGAQYKLGMLYHNGVGKSHPRDYEEAMKWLRMAADQGNVDAEDRVGLMYYLGEGVTQDHAEAVRWYRQAAEKGNGHAQWQLVEIYQRGDGVPRDLAESKRWAQHGRHPDRSALIARVAFLLIGVALLAFALGLFALQYHKLSGWKHCCVAVFVHAGGTFLVINSLITYGFWIVVPHCKFGFLAPACTQFTDPHTRSIVNEIASYAMVNLIWRFMAGVGMALDLLAGWYAVYLWRFVIRRGRGTKVTPAAGVAQVTL